MLHEMTPAEYHADPCAKPSLSASIANVLCERSPLHAWHVHPKLGGRPCESTKEMNEGSLIHRLMLGVGTGVEVIAADNFKTKLAREARDAAIEAGLVPVLERELHRLQRVADTLTARLREEYGIVLSGQKEVVVTWREMALSGDVECRGMLDHWDSPLIDDLKRISSADPDTIAKHVVKYGYAIQEAAYRRGIEQTFPELAGRVRFRFIFFETREPYAITPVELAGSAREFGEARWRRAVETWAQCLSENHWPAYTDGVLRIEAPAWALAKEMVEDDDEDI